MGSAGRTATFLFMLAGQILVAASFAQSPDDSRILCKRESVTASRLPQPRTCRSMAQWRELEKQRDVDRKTEGQILRREELGSQPVRPPPPQ